MWGGCTGVSVCLCVYVCICMYTLLHIYRHIHTHTCSGDSNIYSKSVRYIYCMDHSTGTPELQRRVNYII